MLSFSRNRKISTALVTLPVCLAAALLGGCYGRDQLPYHAVHNPVGGPVHGKPRSVFVDPVGYRYRDIVQRTRASAYAPMPQISRPGETPVPKARTAPRAGMTPKAAAADAMPVADSKSSLAAKNAAGDAAPTASSAASASMAAAPTPTVEVVPAMRDAAEGRATTQMRR